MHYLNVALCLPFAFLNSYIDFKAKYNALDEHWDIRSLGLSHENMIRESKPNLSKNIQKS